MPCRYFADRSRIFAKQKYGSERYTDVPRTDTARNSLMKSEVEKRLRRFSFIGYAKKSCAGNFALRARCKSRTARNYFLSRAVKNVWRVFLLSETRIIPPHCSELFFKSEVEKRLARFSFIGYAKKSCAGNFALRARCKSRTARNCSDKSKGEKRPSRFSFINTLAISPHCSKSRALVLILSII